MRQSLIVIAASLLAAACGVPEVELPEGNEALTDESTPVVPLSKPTLKDVPTKYPSRDLPLRGTALNAARVIVRGAGNPRLVLADPRNGDFCMIVDLPTAPAEYTLQVQSQSSEGKLSEVTEVTVIRSADAPAPSGLKNCLGDPL